MIVVFTDTAEADLEQIGDYIAVDSPRRASTFTRQLRMAAENLGQYPESYPLLHSHETTGIRRRPYGNYLIFYAIRPEYIVIQLILNSAQDYEAILFPES